MSEKNRSIRKGVILTVCFIGVIVSFVILLLVIGANHKVNHLCDKLDVISKKMDYLQKNDCGIVDRIKRIENHIVPSDSNENVWNIKVRIDGDKVYITYSRYLTAPVNFVFITAVNHIYTSTVQM